MYFITFDTFRQMFISWTGQGECYELPPTKKFCSHFSLGRLTCTLSYYMSNQPVQVKKEMLKCSKLISAFARVCHLAPNKKGNKELTSHQRRPDRGGEQKQCQNPQQPLSVNLKKSWFCLEVWADLLGNSLVTMYFWEKDTSHYSILLLCVCNLDACSPTDHLCWDLSATEAAELLHDVWSMDRKGCCHKIGQL